MKDRISNGYKLIYEPNHPNAMVNNRKWKGYVYEHIVVASNSIGRPLREDEEVHHLDFDKMNNHPQNLIVLLKSSHSKLHQWLNNGAVTSKDVSLNPVNSKKPKSRCENCNQVLYSKLKRFCCRECRLEMSGSKMDEYSLEHVLSVFLNKKSFLQVGKYFNISDNGLRKWLKTRHNISDKATLSQALSTLKEGAETSGEV